jgi:hypothetical protein
MRATCAPELGRGAAEEGGVAVVGFAQEPDVLAAQGLRS